MIIVFELIYFVVCDSLMLHFFKNISKIENHSFYNRTDKIITYIHIGNCTIQHEKLNLGYHIILIDFSINGS